MAETEKASKTEKPATNGQAPSPSRLVIVKLPGLRPRVAVITGVDTAKGTIDVHVLETTHAGLASDAWSFPPRV